MDWLHLGYRITDLASALAWNHIIHSWIDPVAIFAAACLACFVMIRLVVFIFSEPPKKSDDTKSRPENGRP